MARTPRLGLVFYPNQRLAADSTESCTCLTADLFSLEDRDGKVSLTAAVGGDLMNHVAISVKSVDFHSGRSRNRHRTESSLWTPTRIIPKVQPGFGVMLRKRQTLDG